MRLSGTSARIFEESTLDSRRARLAFPLVQLSSPSVSLADWMVFVRRFSRLSPRSGGILGLKDRRGCFHAVFTYRVDRNLSLGKFLRVADMVVGNLPGKTLGDAILSTADRIAKDTGCETIVLESPTIAASLDTMPHPETRPYAVLRSDPAGKAVTP